MTKAILGITFLVGLLSTAATVAAVGQAEISSKDSYLGGPEVCERYSKQRGGEHAIWTTVPIDYEHPERGSFPLYAWTMTPFDAQKKTMIFVAMGPGNTAHSSALKLEDWNIIFFDQRGLSCSRPPTRELYHDSHFYSSMNTARDMEEIRKRLGLEKISLYGVSYGTVPAHLYAALYKDHTRSVVLEAVIFQSDATTLIENPHRVQLLQKFFEDLPENMQNRILEISENPDFSPFWFSHVGLMMLKLDRPWIAFRKFLDSILWNEPLLKALLPNFDRRNSPETEFGFGLVMSQMVSCKELGMNTPGASFSATFKGRRLVAERNNSLREQNCEPWGFQAHDKNQTFQATQYPLKVPVTYIHGTLDGAISAQQAVKSFKFAAQGPAQLVLVKEGGHLPLQDPLSSGFERGPALTLRQTLLATALEGKSLPAELLRKLSSHTNMQWTFLQRSTKR